MPPSSPKPSPPRRRRGARPDPKPRRRRLAPARPFLVIAIGSVVILAVAAVVGTWISIRERPARRFAAAEAATQARDWPRAFAAWHDWNATELRSVATLMAEARSAQALDRGRDAELAAESVTRLDPSSADARLIQLNRLRVLDQPAEAIDLGLSALTRLRTSGARRAILMATTLAALAEVPDAEARNQLDRWIAADPDDSDAQVARMSRVAANPHPGDSDRARRIVELGQIVTRSPNHVAAREALTVALADAGEVDRGRATLDGWPEPRDHRFDRLQARWDLEYNHEPARAAEGFRRALLKVPHDWKLHYGLARTLRILKQPTEAGTEALAVARLRERLEPSTLGPRLATDFARIDGGSEAESAQAMLDLATLCRGVGLSNLADAWEREAGRGY